MTASGTIPAGTHRMTDPRIRMQTIFLASAMLAVSWGAISILGGPHCAAFTKKETRELASLPVPLACIKDILPPQVPSNPLPGVTP